MDVPTVPLETLYGEQLIGWLNERGTTIRVQTSVDKLELESDRITGIKLANGEIETADEFVVAVPFFRIRSILPEAINAHPDLAGIDQLETAPIASIHLWFDRPITELRHAVLIDRMCQWVFNRTAIGSKHQANSTPDKSYYYQVVISASQDLASRSRDDIQQQVLQELTQVWPVTASAKLLHSRQVFEHRAVFSPTPGVDALRPLQQSPVPNLQLAGDWTRTGWPATMEGAVRSGYLAATNILQRHGQTKSLLQPDLPVATASNILFGL
jgi:uncharacterized protein with NAD-binding domain and iron-sulfur cluster